VENTAAHVETQGFLERNIRPWVRLRTAPALLGATIPSGSIFWAHLENFSRRSEAYAEMPPTVSRAIVDPLIASPFALLMIAGAFFLTIAVTQIARAVANCLHQSAKTRRSSWWLLYVMAVCEAAAIAGMIILSQFTGDQHAFVHDTGSYMLFFGHAIAITSLGVLIRRMLADPVLSDLPAIDTLAKHPTHANWVTGLSFAFGLVYFASKLSPDTLPFLEHLVFSILEMIVLLAFLTFLGRFSRFLAASGPAAS
jgi:hypothetical protein